MPSSSIGTSTSPHQHGDVTTGPRTAASITLQRWIRGHWEVRRAIRLLGLLASLNDAEVHKSLARVWVGEECRGVGQCSVPSGRLRGRALAHEDDCDGRSGGDTGNTPVDGGHPVAGSSSAPAPSGTAHKLSQKEATVLTALVDLSCMYEEELHAANWERRLLLDELMASSDVLRGASEATRRTLSRTHPQLRRLNLLPASTRNEWRAGFVDMLDVSRDVDLSPRAALDRLTATIGAAHATWLLSTYLQGKRCGAEGTARAPLPPPTLQMAWDTVRRFAEEDGRSPPSSSRRTVPTTAHVDGNLTGIEDIPPLAAPHDTNGNADDAAEKTAVVVEAESALPLPLQSLSPLAREADEGEGSGEDEEEDVEDSDEAYYHKRNQQSDALEAKLRQRLGLPKASAEQPEGEDKGSTGGDGGTQRDGSQSDDDAGQALIPARDALRDVRVPILGQGRRHVKQPHPSSPPPPLSTAAAMARAVCAVCELDGLPFSSDVAEVDADTVANEQLLWPCRSCGALVHWDCSLSPTLVEEHGGLVVLFCSQACRTDVAP